MRNANDKKIGAIRLTGQVTPRNKLGFYIDYQKNCTGSAYEKGGEQCRDRGDDWIALNGGFNNGSPESGNVWDDREKIVQASWTSPVTNKLLLEAGLSSFNSRWGGQAPAGALMDFIPVVELVAASGIAACRCRSSPIARRGASSATSTASISSTTCGARRCPTSPARTT